MADIDDSIMIRDYMNSTKVKCCDYETLPTKDARDDIIYAVYSPFEMGVDFCIYYCHKWVTINCLLQNDTIYKDVHDGNLICLERYKLAARALKSLDLKDSEYPLIFKHMINDTIDTSIDFDMLRLNNNFDFAMRSDIPKAYYSSKKFLEENNITVDKQYVSLEDVLHRELFSEEELLKFRMLVIYGYLFNKETDTNTRELLRPIAAKLMLEVRRKYE